MGAVWSELVSAVFPVKQGKYREIFQKLPVKAAWNCRNARETAAFITLVTCDTAKRNRE